MLIYLCLSSVINFDKYDMNVFQLNAFDKWGLFKNDQATLIAIAGRSLLYQDEPSLRFIVIAIREV
jgi:hypothetical protein